MSSDNKPVKEVKRSYPFWLGGVAASMAACLTHPLDLTKVRMQTMPAKDRQNMLRTMINTVKDQGEGVFNLDS